MNIQQNETIVELIGRITAFSQQCKQAEYTDTGEAWYLLNSIKNDLRRILDPKKQKGPHITRGKEAKILCPKCGPVTPKLAEEGYTVNHELVSFNKKTGITAHAWTGDSDEMSEEGSRLVLECPMCFASWPLPESIEVEWL